MKVLCIGHAAYDITIPVDSYPVENTKNRISKRIECGGGPASNAAYLLAKWNIETYFAGMVGDDLYGDRIKKEFEEAGVNTKYLIQSKDYQTTSSFVIANQDNGNRTIFAYRPPSVNLGVIDFDFTPDFILIDGHEPELSKETLKKYPSAISVIDAGRPKKEVIELCYLVNYLVCSKEFAEQVSGIKVDYDNLTTITDIYNYLKNEFKNNVVITLEDKGCVYEQEGDIKIMSSLKVKALDSTGAGDIYHGAFMYGLTQNFDIEKVVSYANLAGAISVTRVGGRYSIPTLEEVNSKYASLK